MSESKKAHAGLSPSSFATFQACPRKYWHAKIAETPFDHDAPEDTEALDVGKTFHQALEDTKHSLSGFTLDQLRTIALKHYLTEDHLPMLWMMLLSYKRMHEKAGLEAIAWEVEIDTPSVYGFVDVILRDSDGGIWIGDMKTAASYSPSALLPTLLAHPQLNLYAANIDAVAKVVGFDASLFRGCRYRLTTKSKLIRKSTESFDSFCDRLAKSVASYDIILPRDRMRSEHVLAAHGRAVDHISRSKDQADYPTNYGSCMQYFRPCSFFGRCHGGTFTDAAAPLLCISSTGE